MHVLLNLSYIHHLLLLLNPLHLLLNTILTN
jgi:hypothetical protein